MNAPQKTPPRIVDPDGRVHVGWFDQPFRVANLQDAPVDHLLSALRGSPLRLVERAYRKMRLKQWHYASVVTDRVLFACAVVDAGYIGTAFAYVVDRRSGQMYQWSRLSPLGLGVSMSPNSVEGRTSAELPGFGRLVFENDPTSGRRRIEAELKGRQSLHAHIDIVDRGRDPDPVVVVEQVDTARWLYTHKCYGLSAGGRIACGDLVDEVAMGEASAGIDWNRGYRKTETYWNWAAAAGQATSGERVGFNLTAHRPWEKTETSQATQAAVAKNKGEADAHDCALWLDGRCVKIRRVEFDYDPKNHRAPWRISDDAGLVDLEFVADGVRTEDINLGLVVSRFHQPYGRFSGRLSTPEGQVFSLDNVYGVTEQHFARW